MKKLMLLLPLFLLGGWNYLAEKDEYVNYYYYQGSQYHLDRTYDRVFFEFTSNNSLSGVRSLLGDKSVLFNLTGYDPSENRQIVELNTPQDDAGLRELVKDLNLLPGIENASPVFKMPEGKGNPNTYIGVEKEIIAQFKDNVADNTIQSYLSGHNLEISGEFDISGGKTYLIRVPKGEYAINFANDLYLSGLVNYSEPNLFFTDLMQSFTPNDPFYPQQWSHRNTGSNIPQGITGIPGCDMRTDSAWDVTTGSPSVIVSIVDSGIDTLHEDLSQRIINGLSINTFSNLPNAWDDNNHGTACSGIVAATGNNNMGVTGVAPLSRLFGVKIFNSAGSTNSTAIVNGMIAAWQRGSWISSNSWGGGSPISAAENAILDGVNLGRNGKGVVWCFATGNSNASSISWPSTLSTVISVGGISPCNQRKSTSSCDSETWWGAQYGTGLEIVSPCTKIYTTDRTGSVGYSTGNYVENFNGTSSATPNVSGVCALVLAVDSNLTWDSVRVRIARTADKVGSYTYNQPGQLGIGGWNNEMGYGKINANRVVRLTQQMISGTPLIPFALQNPQPGARVVSYPTSTLTATFTWDTTGVNASFNWFFGTSLPNRLIVMSTGSSKEVTLTLGELDNILGGLGVAAGDSLVGQWNVMAYRAPNTSGPDSLMAANGPRNVTLVRGIPPLTAFNLVSPPNNSTVQTTPTDYGLFNPAWRKSGQGVKYKWIFAYPNFSSASNIKMIYQAANNGFDTSASIRKSHIDSALVQLGLSATDSITGQWRAYAYNSAGDSLASSQAYNITLRRLPINTITVGTGTEVESYPLDRFYNYMRWQGLWLSNELNFTGSILKIKFYQNNSVGGVSMQNVKIFMKETPETTLPTANWDSSGSTMVFNGTVTSLSAPGWCEINLTTPFMHTSGNNLQISIGRDFQQYVETYPMYAYTVTTAYLTRRNRLDASYPPSLIQSYNRANIQMEYSIATGIEGNTAFSVPDVYSISQNYPNPFNPSTKISYGIPKNGLVNMKIYDLLGKEIATLVNEEKQAGYYDLEFNASHLASGVYFYKLQVNDFIATRRMVLIK